MKKFASVQNIKHEIDAYEKHFTGAPLLVGIDGNADYVALLSALTDDYSKQIIRTSSSCGLDFPPDPAFQLSLISSEAKKKPTVWLGAVQAKMLYGQQATEAFLINLLGTNFGGPVTVLCPYCTSILESIARNYTKLGYNIVIVSGNERTIPMIHVSSDDQGLYIGEGSVHGIKALLEKLEDGHFGQVIRLVTTCKFAYLEGSMFPVAKGESSYQSLCKQEPGIAANTQENNGSEAQWNRLAISLQAAGSLSNACEEALCPVQKLQDNFGDYLAADRDTRFLCFVSLKAFFGQGNDYLAHCLRKSITVDDLEANIYMAILEIKHGSPKFNTWIRQRRRMISLLDENSAMMKDFCTRATIKGKDILWYLSDETEEERAALIHALCCYPYTPEELDEIMPSISPNLAAYLRLFTFDEFNTKVVGSDPSVRTLFTAYFQRYKIQKLTNHKDRDFLDIVEAEAKPTGRSFTKLPARSAIVKKLDKKDARPYFFDALGVEFLAFMQAKAEEYGMQFECSIGRCNLPSITSLNKEFYEAFPEGSILKEEGLDELKHRGTKYDYRFTTEPLHIFDELAILDRDLKKMGSALAMGQCQRIIILSDHGASRLAVTYESEYDKIQLEEPGKHSGRCCLASQDPYIEFVVYESGFACIANYERFKGSRKADVETHGGASLEETVVPIIILTQKPKEQQLFFVEPVVPCSVKEGSSIRLFANPPLKNPRMIVDKQPYDGKFEGDTHNVAFAMPDIRRRGRYIAEIYDGGMKKGELTFETTRQTGTNQLL